MSHPPSTQSVAEMRVNSGNSPRPDVAHRRRRPRDEPGAVLERAAVLVGALIAQRRQELVKQIAVRGVDLDHAKARGVSARLAAAANAAIVGGDASAASFRAAADSCRQT